MRISRSSSPSTLTVRLIAVLTAASLVACTQAEGETCQIDSDCEDGLLCQREPAADRGECARKKAGNNEMQDLEDVPLGPDRPPPEDDAGSPQAGGSG